MKILSKDDHFVKRKYIISASIPARFAGYAISALSTQPGLCLEFSKLLSRFEQHKLRKNISSRTVARCKSFLKENKHRYSIQVVCCGRKTFLTKASEMIETPLALSEHIIKSFLEIKKAFPLYDFLQKIFSSSRSFIERLIASLKQKFQKLIFRKGKELWIKMDKKTPSQECQAYPSENASPIVAKENKAKELLTPGHKEPRNQEKIPEKLRRKAFAISRSLKYEHWDNCKVKYSLPHCVNFVSKALQEGFLQKDIKNAYRGALERFHSIGVDMGTTECNMEPSGTIKMALEKLQKRDFEKFDKESSVSESNEYVNQGMKGFFQEQDFEESSPAPSEESEKVKKECLEAIRKNTSDYNYPTFEKLLNGASVDEFSAVELMVLDFELERHSEAISKAVGLLDMPNNAFLMSGGRKLSL